MIPSTWAGRPHLMPFTGRWIPAKVKGDLHVLEPGIAVLVIVGAAVMALRSPRVVATRRMRGAGIDAFGGEVRLLELAAPASPAPDEVVISVQAAGVGNWDEFVRVGDWDVGREPPLALGVEAAGVVA